MTRRRRFNGRWAQKKRVFVRISFLFEGGWTGLCDTSEYSWNAPYHCGWHNWAVTKCSGDTMGKKALDCAAGVLSMTAIDVICDPQLLENAKAEWQERMEGRTYESLLEEEMKPPVDINKDVMEKYRK